MRNLICFIVRVQTSVCHLKLNKLQRPSGIKEKEMLFGKQTKAYTNLIELNLSPKYIFPTRGRCRRDNYA